MTVPDKLPELPEDASAWIHPRRYGMGVSFIRQNDDDAPLFDADQMRAYAVAAIEATRPKWSADLPTGPGWYWSRHPDERTRCVNVIEDDGILYVGAMRVLSHSGWQWSGPIPQPAKQIGVICAKDDPC